MRNEVGMFVLGAFAGLVLGTILVLGIAASAMQREDNEAIKRGYKVYDTKTGELKWKESDDATQKE